MKKISPSYVFDDKKCKYIIDLERQLLSLSDSNLLEMLLKLVHCKQPLKNATILLEKFNTISDVIAYCDPLYTEELINDDVHLLFKIINVLKIREHSYSQIFDKIEV